MEGTEDQRVWEVDLLHQIKNWWALSLIFALLGGSAWARDATLVPAPSQHLDSVLSPLLGDRLFRDSRIGLHVVNVRTGEEVFSSHADRSLVPASTMKVVTAATALKELGPSYRFTTAVFTGGPIASNGALKGNLYVKGGGDPSFVVEKLWKMVYDLKLQGIEKVEGDIVFDESFFKPDYPLPGWNKEEDLKKGPSYFPALSALSLNFNTVTLVVGPGDKAGAAARVRLETPVGKLVTIDNALKTGSAKSRWRIDIDRELDDEKVAFKVTGSVPSRARVRMFRRTVPDPTAHFMAAFRQMLASQDMTVRGRFRRGSTPSWAKPLLNHRSAPLAAILMDMNKYSNNFIAEQVLRTVGAEASEASGTTEAGLHEVEQYLNGLGIADTEFHLVNGSGLSRKALLRPSTLTALLLDMAHDPEIGREFWSSLAIAGLDGTLWYRLKDNAGRLRGKTGTIDGVHCLAGYVLAQNDEMYAFAFMVNNLKGGSSRARALHDQFAQLIFAISMDSQPVAERRKP